MGPQDDMQEIHLWPLCSAHWKESLDWKLATPRGKMQGDRLKLLFLFTYLKCRLCHCCPRSGSLLHSAWKPKSSRWPWSALCALNTQGCDLLPLLLPLLIPFQSHGLSSPDQGMANSFTSLVFAQQSPSQWGLLWLLYFAWKLLLLSIFPH